MNVGLTRRGEVIMMLREVWKTLPKDPIEREVMEQCSVTRLVDIKPSSLEFVLKEAISELGGVL